MANLYRNTSEDVYEWSTIAVTLATAKRLATMYNDIVGEKFFSYVSLQDNYPHMKDSKTQKRIIRIGLRPDARWLLADGFPYRSRLMIVRDGNVLRTSAYIYTRWGTYQEITADYDPTDAATLLYDTCEAERRAVESFVAEQRSLSLQNGFMLPYVPTDL